jgi:DNA-binding PucR family transcriptional regulator
LETGEGDQALAAGLGRLCHRIDDYATSYTEAALGLDIACRRPRPGELLSPDDLGLYGILAHGSARGSLESIVDNTLGPLIAADDKGGSEYVKTLEAFLASDRHLERTAAALHIHVNTVRYRLGKIQDDLGVDLHDVDTRFLIELALRVQAALHRH